MSNLEDIRNDLKILVVERLGLDTVKPEQIDDKAPLFGEGLGLDSVDALELVVALEQKYSISIKSHEVDESVFTSIETLASFVESAKNE